MMALNSGSGLDSSSLPSRTMLQKAPLRRRRSKGTIAGFASKGGEPPNATQKTSEVNGENVGQLDHSGSVNASSTSGQGNKPQHVDSSAAPTKPCHAARLALMCSQNAVRMGARTQLGLCPPGRGRRGLKAALRQRNRSNRALSRRAAGQSSVDIGGYFGVDKMIGSETLDDYPAQEEDFLLTTNTFDTESDEEASSGDEDELLDVDLLLKEDAPDLDDEKKYLNLSEPLFTPIGAENALTSSAGGPMAGVGTGKLPFNRRKLRYFDSITAVEKMAARSYLTAETRRSKQRELMLLSKHLRRMQRQEKKRIKQERGETVDEPDLSDPESDDGKEKGVVSAGVHRFESPMTPAVAASLLLESLSLNALESIEGMAKCYEGIVAAGVALLESSVGDPTSPVSEGGGDALRTRSEIMAALTPLLITSLEQPSGEVVLCLARLRRMCGTPRYQRRFVQRVAPSLIRPPRGAMWCLRHQNDMEPILAAAELIFDSASEIFSKGWYDRGQLLLADTKRAETLNTAATQLRNLSTGPSESLTLGSLGHSWRSNKYKTGNAKDAAKASNGTLAEWEVIAVDRQIRISISNIISMDWSRVVVHSRDSEMSRSYHRSRASTKRPSALPQASTGDMSPKSIVAPPLSPLRTTNMKAPGSPSGPSQPAGSFQSEAMESAFTANFASTLDPPADRARSPLPPSSAPQPTPLSPPAPNRTGTDNIESRIPGDQFSAPSNLFPPAGHTPPRSPTPMSPKRDITELPSTVPTTMQPGMSPLSPKQSKRSPYVKESIFKVSTSSSAQTQLGGDKDRAPLSPSSLATGNSPDSMPHRPISSAASIASSLTGTIGAQPSHYRMLTSTAAERKRTVAACRALRAQITRFEDAFIQIHGRPPKGASERAPLATTYAQYREWKRAIRADAACRIQAMFRGASTRWTLLRSNNPRISQVIMTRAGRQSFVERGSRIQNTGSDNLLKQLSIPSEIGELEQEKSIVALTDADGFLTQSQIGNSQSLVPQWGNQIVRRRTGSGDGFSGSPIPVPKPTSSPSTSVASKNSDFGRLPLSDLQARKRELKQQLKQYDMNFARRHGRMPVKAEKEPIRHLYEKYNSLKSQISQMEQEGRISASSSPVSFPQSSTVLTQRTVSPVGSDTEESPVAARRVKQPVKEQDLSTLKAEKGRLHQMLRSYEKDFFKEHKRQVSSFADIRPVAQQYRRYKEIKKAISSLQEK